MNDKCHEDKGTYVIHEFVTNRGWFYLFKDVRTQSSACPDYGILRAMKIKNIAPLLFVILLLIGCDDSSTPAPTLMPTRVPPTATPQPDPTAAPTPAPTATPEFIAYEAPDWFENGVLYEIYVRSFADSDGDGIGDFNGITENLDYIEALHVDVVWLMPIHPSPSVHGYNVTDYMAVNPEYGTMDDFRSMVDAFHERGIRVVIDFVSSHASSEHPFFLDAFNHPESVYDDWFRFTNDANTSYDGFDGLPSLPRFNHFNKEVKQYMTEAALFWLDLDGDGDYTDGVDGFRVDNASFPPKSYFVDWRQQVKRANPDALLLGEAWVLQVEQLKPYFEDQFDALFNFQLMELLDNSLGENADGEVRWEMPPSLIGNLMNSQAAKYPAEGIVVQFVSNHDTDRLASMFNGSLEWQKLTAAFTIILPESFALYYGEEIGMFGVKGGPPHYDSYRREPLDWYAAGEGPGQTNWFKVPDRWNRPYDGVSVEEQENDPNSLLNTYRHLLELRQSNDALKDGDFVVLTTQAVGRKAWSVSRTAGDQTVIGIFNFGEEAVDITLPSFPISSDALLDLISGEMYPGSTAGESYTLTLPEAGAVWLTVP